MNKDQEEYLISQIDTLRTQLTEAVAGSRQLMQAMDAILVSAATKYGKPVKDGYELTIPRPDTTNLQEWFVTADRNEKSETYKIKIIRKSKEGGT